MCAGKCRGIGKKEVIKKRNGKREQNIGIRRHEEEKNKTRPNEGERGPRRRD